MSPTADRFTVSGTRNGSLVQISWSGGELSGDPPTIDLVLVEAMIARDQTTDPLVAELFHDAPDGFDLADPLGDPRSAYYLISRVFDTIRDASGDVPPTRAHERRG
jgi:hypothetical protein